MSSKRKPTDPLTERVRVMEEENMNEESPKHGPTLSTSTSSVGGIKTYDPKLEIAAKSFFTKAEDYITNELDTINIDFRTLTDMNNLMQNNYAQVQPNVEQLKKYSIDIAHKYNEMVSVYFQSFSNLTITLRLLTLIVLFIL